nr:MAG TPA: hypothetical protein [Caudoviricetes sp.]
MGKASYGSHGKVRFGKAWSDRVGQARLGTAS